MNKQDPKDTFITTESFHRYSYSSVVLFGHLFQSSLRDASTNNKTEMRTSQPEQNNGQNSTISDDSSSILSYTIPRVSSPHPSALNRKQQADYLQLYTRFSKSMPSAVLETEKKDFARFKSLHKQIVDEQAKFNKFAKRVAEDHRENYKFVNLSAQKYRSDVLPSFQELLLQYARYYTIKDMCPLISANAILHKVPLMHVQTLLEMGQVDTLSHPNVNTRPAIQRDYYKLTRQNPPVIKILDKTNKPVSKDPNAEKLAVKYKPHIVISSSGLTALFDNQGPSFGNSWMIPVIIKEFQTDEGSSKVVFVDKPLQNESKDQSLNYWYHKLASKFLCTHFKHPDAHVNKQSVGHVEDDEIDQDVFDSSDICQLETFSTEKSEILSSSASKIETDVVKNNTSSSSEKSEIVPNDAKDEQIAQSEHNEMETEKDVCGKVTMLSQSTGVVDAIIGTENHNRKEYTVDNGMDADLYTDSDEGGLVIDEDNDDSNQRMKNQGDCDKISDVKKLCDTPEATVHEAKHNSQSQPSAVEVTKDTLTSDLSCNTETTHLQASGSTKCGTSAVRRSHRLAASKEKSESNDALNITDKSDIVLSRKRMAMGKYNILAGKKKKIEDNESTRVKPAEDETQLIQNSTLHNFQSPLDEILKLQEKLSCFESPSKNLGTNTAEKYGCLEPAEDCGAYEMPPIGRNVTYNMWTLDKKLRLLIRCTLDTKSKRKKTERIRFFTIIPKLEYQPWYGGEVLTNSECAAEWIAATIRPNSRILRLRINAFTSEVLAVESLDKSQIEASAPSFKPRECLKNVYNLLEKLYCMQPGQYLLIHGKGEAIVRIMKNVEFSARGECFDLHTSCHMSDDDSDSVPWLPIDPSVIFPSHFERQRIPGTFEPKEIWSGKNKGGNHGGRGRGKGKGKGKKGKGRGGKIGNQLS